MKQIATIVALFIVCSVISPVTTQAISLVSTKHVQSSIPYTRQVTGVHNNTPYESRPGGYPTQLRGDDGQSINDGKWMMAFCVQPGVKAHDGAEGELSIKTAPLAEKKGELQAAWLMDMFYNDAHDEHHLAASSRIRNAESYHHLGRLRKRELSVAFSDRNDSNPQ